jgi:hypothetical protein
MRKKLLIGALFLSSFLSTKINAQNVVDSISTPKFTYCEIVGTQKLFSPKVTIMVDYGQERTFFQDIRVRDEQTGKVQAFNSMVDGLNFMGDNGWEFVQAYIVTLGQQNVYHWLLKRKIK